MIRILQTQPWDTLDLQQWFDINGQPYQFVDQAPYDFVTPWSDVPSTKLIFLVWHTYENQVDEFEQHLRDSNVVIISNATQPGYSHPRVIENDFLFNLTLAYYSNFQFTTKNLIWHAGAECYTLPAITVGQPRPQIFTAPGMGRRFEKNRYRSRLRDFLQSHRHLGFIGNPWLPSNKNSETAQPRHLNEPVNDYYYLNSYLSVYSETIEYGRTITVTEKTYNALIKGHLVFPFSSAGLINRLIKLGFHMPSFIDYSYDSVQDDQQRFNVYCHELERLLNIPLSRWHQLWSDNIATVIHNRNWFWQRGFDRVDLKPYINLG